MNSVLTAMVNSLGAGYQFIGVATPTNPGSNQTPDYKCFYLATTPGTYTNLGGLVVADGEVAILKYDSSWTKEVTGIATAAQLNQLAQELGKYYLGIDLDNTSLSNSTTDTDYIFVTRNNGNKHINKIKFVAKTGTINIYKVYAPQFSAGCQVSTTLIASVENSAGENNTIKEIDVDVNLYENEHIGINGSFAYDNIPGQFSGLNVQVSSSTIAQVTNNLALGVMAIADVDSLSILIANEQKPLLKTFGISGLGGDSYTPEFIFLTEKDDRQPKYIRYIEVESFSRETCIYLVTINNNTATTKLLGSVKNNGTQVIPLNIELSDNQRIGISGAMRYISTSEVSLYSSKYVPVDGGNLTNGVVVVDYVLHYAEAEKNEDKIDSVIVDANGKGDYLTVFDALAGTLGKDSASHPINIIVMPGIYNEPTLSHDDDNRYCSNRHLSIIGVDKVNCILRNDKGYYNGSASSEGNLGDNSVIKVSGNVYIANLTIISTDVENADNPDPVYHRSYCIHNDAPSPQNATLEIHNCILKNNHAPCVGFGIGLHNTMKITDCEMESELWNPADWRGDGGALYGHDRVGSSAEIQEYVMVKNCYIKCSNSHAFDYIDANGYLIELTFIGNACDLPNNKGVSIAGTATIGKASCNNNVAGMNFQS